MADTDEITETIRDTAGARKMMARALAGLVAGSISTRTNPQINAVDFPTALNNYCCVRVIAKKFIEVKSYDLTARVYGFPGEKRNER